MGWIRDISPNVSFKYSVSVTGALFWVKLVMLNSPSSLLIHLLFDLAIPFSWAAKVGAIRQISAPVSSNPSQGTSSSSVTGT